MSDLTLIGLGILALIILLFWKRLKGYIVLSQLKRLQNDVNKLDKLAEKDQPEAIRLAMVTTFQITSTIAPLIKARSEESYAALMDKAHKVIAGWISTFSPYWGIDGAIDQVLADMRNHNVDIRKIAELLFEGKYLEAIIVVQDIKNAALCNHLLALIKELKK